MTKFADYLINQLKDEDSFIVQEGKGAAEFANFFDTGSYTLNILLSGTIYGGTPDNRTVQIAGESTTGKTFFALGVVKNFLDDNPNAIVFYYDTERAVNKQMMEDRGIDTERVIRVEKNIIEDVKSHMFKVVDAYSKKPPSERPPMMVVLDSYGAMATTKELTDIAKKADAEAKGKKSESKKDMTKGGEGRSLFRTVTMKLAKVNIPLILTNHTYTAVMTYGAPQVPTGGGGPKFFSDIILILSKAKDRDKNKNVRGNIIKMSVNKGRFTKENSVLYTRILYDSGLDRYYGLLPLAVACGAATKAPKGYSFEHLDKPASEDTIYEDPETYFTEEVLARIDIFARRAFKYGKGSSELPDFATEDEDGFNTDSDSD